MAPLCEIRVFSRRHRFAGTLDVLGIWRRAGALIDYKTGDPRDVAADLQTAAYLGALLEMQTRGDTSDMLVFDPFTHTYTLDGVRLPSVTQILQASRLIDFSKIPGPMLLEARDRGTTVHQALHYYNEDDIDLPAFCAEFPDYAPYIGAWVNFRAESGFVLATSLEQLGKLTHIKRYAVRLKKDGRYTVEPYRSARDYAEFLALLTALQIRERRKGSWIELAEVA
jgi:hypothetical protein